MARTEGVPLFVEELTKSVLESGLLHEDGDQYTLPKPLPALAIPTSLRDSLVARLDRLAPVKEVIQIGACIGREFSYQLLAADLAAARRAARGSSAEADRGRAGVQPRHGTGRHLHFQACLGAGRRLRLSAQEQKAAAARAARRGAEGRLRRPGRQRAGAAGASLHAVGESSGSHSAGGAKRASWRREEKRSTRQLAISKRGWR